MNHNNIYSILGKLESLQPKEQPEQQAPSLKEYAEVPARGSILEGVDAIEARLKQKFNESGLQYYTGVKKHGEEYMKKAAAAGRAGASQEELGRLKDKYSKAHKNEDVAQAVCKECGMTEGSCEHTKMAEVKPQPTAELVKKIRARLAQLNDAFYQQKGYEMEPEEAIEQVADEMNISTRQVDKLLQDERFFEDKEKTTHKGGEVTHKDGVTRHTKKDYPGYQSDDDEDEDDENKGKRGRPRKHAKKADTGEKKGRGRPKKEKAPEYDKRHDPFGRVKAGAEKSGKEIKGEKHSMDEVAPPGAKAERMVKGIKKSLSKDGHLSGKDKAIAYATTWKAHKAGTVEEAMSSLQRRLTEGVNFAELLREKQQTVDEMLTELGNDIKVFKETGHCSELLRDCMEIKGYHGKMVADEAAQVPSKMDQFGRPDAFAYVKPEPKGIPGNLPTAQVPGKDRLLKGKGPEFFGTGKPMPEDLTLEDELNELARLAGLDEVSRGEYIKQQDSAAEKSGKDKFNAFGQVFDTDEIKEVSRGEYIKQQDDEAEQAGKDKFNAFGQEFDTDEVNEEDLEEDKIDVEDAPDATNKPKPKHFNVNSLIRQGDDLHREKSQNPAAAAKGDNPLTNKMTLEDRLAAEYESIKKVTK